MQLTMSLSQQQANKKLETKSKGKASKKESKKHRFIDEALDSTRNMLDSNIEKR